MGINLNRNHQKFKQICLDYEIYKEARERSIRIKENELNRLKHEKEEAQYIIDFLAKHELSLIKELEPFPDPPGEIKFKDPIITDSRSIYNAMTDPTNIFTTTHKYKPNNGKSVIQGAGACGWI